MPMFPSGVIPQNRGWPVDRNAGAVYLDGTSDELTRTMSGADADTTRGIFVVSFRRIAFSNQNLYFEASGFGGIDIASNQLRVNSFDSGGTQRIYTCGGLLRDSNWYLAVISIDMNEATDTDKVQFRLSDGLRTTTVSNAGGTGNGLDMLGARSRVNFEIGSGFAGTLSQYVKLDGVSLQNGDYAIGDLWELYAFGENGSQYVPRSDADLIALADAVGGNSFVLDFADSGSLGTDASVNGNDFTPVSMSSGNWTPNTPSNPHAIVNPLDKNTSGLTVGNGGANLTTTTNNTYAALSQPVTIDQQWYVEFERTDTDGSSALGWIVGIAPLDVSMQGNLTTSALGQALYSSYNGPKIVNGSQAAYGSTWRNNFDVVGLFFDGPAGELSFSVNGVDQGVLATGLTDSQGYRVILGRTGGTTATTLRVWTSPSEWTYTPPAGYLALSDANNGRLVADPQGGDWFGIILDTGDATNDRSLTGMGNESDLIIRKKRSASLSWKWIDRLRGLGNVVYSDATNVEQAETWLDSIDPDGLTIDNANNANDSAATYATYGFRAGGAGVVNNDGTIASTVSVAPAGHFGIVSYTGNGTAGATVGHGLPGAPEMVLVKNIDRNASWAIYHTAVTATASVAFDTAAAITNAGSWNNTAPNGTVIILGNAAALNANTEAIIAYAFRSVPGVARVGRYIGNGSTDGPFVWCGFRPRWLLIKRTDSANNWIIWDTARNTFNAVDKTLYPNLSSAEQSGTYAIDVLSDGFKVRDSQAADNASGGTYLYLALADIAGGGELPPVFGR